MFSALIIDADAEARAAIQTALAPYGFEFDKSHDAPEAMNMARAAAPDIIFLRVELPSASGFSVCNKLRRSDETKYIPLVMYASDVTDDVFQQHRNLKTHADEYLRMPFDGNGLVAAVRALIPNMSNSQASGDGLEVDLEEADAGAAASPDMGEFDEGFEEMSGEDTNPGAVPPGDPLAVETEAAFDALLGDEAFELDDEGGAEPLVDTDSEPEAIEAVVEEDALLVDDEPEPEPEPEPPSPRRAETRARASEPEQEEDAGDSTTGGRSPRREVLDLKKELVQKDREILALKDEAEGKERTVLDAKHRNRELQAQLGELEAKVLELEGHVLEEQEKAEAAEANRQTVLKREEGLKSRVEALQKKVRDLEQQIIEAEGSASDAQKTAEGRIAALETAGGEKDGKIGELEQKVAGQAEEIQEQQATIEFQESQLDRLRKQIKDNEDRVSALNDELENTRSEKKRIESDAEQLRGRVAEHEKMARALEERIDSQDQRITSLQGDLEGANQRGAEADKLAATRLDAARRAQQALAVALKVLE